MSVESSSEHRNCLRYLRGIIPSRRRCSYCGSGDHNIKTCDSELLTVFERLCISMRSILEINRFRNWLFDYSINHSNTIKAYAISRCDGCTTSTNVVICVQLVIEKINILHVDRLREQEIVRQIQSNINRDHDYTNLETVLTGLLGVLSNKSEIKIDSVVIECTNLEKYECGICYESKENNEFITFNCEHKFCKDCVKQHIKKRKTYKPTCAFCRSEINCMKFPSNKIENEFIDCFS